MPALLMALGAAFALLPAGSCTPAREHEERDMPEKPDTPEEPDTQRVTIGGPCEICPEMYEGMPDDLDWQTTIASDSEPGERLEISGTIYRIDGKTPAPDVILYVYHTDANGYYSPAPGATGAARTHGHLRGWLRTNSQGAYRFTSIRPASYPASREPGHMHPVIEEPGKNAYYIDDFMFDDDPHLTPERRERLENRGGSGIVRLTRNSDSVWTGRRDIILGRNIPDYR